VQEELGRTKEQVVQLEKAIANLKTELDTAHSQLKEKEAHAQELTTELEKTKKETFAQLAAEREASQRQFETITDQSTKKLSESEKRIADLTEQLKSVSAERDAAKSKFSEKQSELEAMENELAKAKEATEQAKAAELENAANAAKDAEAERSKMQSALDQANAEIERLKSELGKGSPFEEGDSVSPPR
jgi:peptidoglycan DL-endopeptidase CwlO